MFLGSLMLTQESELREKFFERLSSLYSRSTVSSKQGLFFPRSDGFDYFYSDNPLVLLQENIHEIVNARGSIRTGWSFLCNIYWISWIGRRERFFFVEQTLNRILRGKRN